ncbi:glycosyltransferase [Halomonas llamarensis]|uniref:Glycosyltransferase n=1 Tax=Halomonas llamarensis TaxID=2945104 RepID=A0ABT0SP69_9GAMM|nr:glycosyltransferase [Halomonas llamarensis]MCL7929598.1 glycosyltransferase [Halomonas llamarensis]
MPASSPTPLPHTATPPTSDLTTAVQGRPLHVLWANAYCLMDTASGAAMAVREMLRQLDRRGAKVSIVGATVFDDPSGTARFGAQWTSLDASTKPVITVKDPPLTHLLVKTASTQRSRMTAREEALWVSLYRKVLEESPPDVVYYYGGHMMDLLIADEARQRGIPCVAYLANGNYHDTRWCRDVSMILTDSHATARHYQQRLDIAPQPVGAFIDPAPVVAAHTTRERLLFVNPLLEKGAAVVIRLALELETRRPDIVIEVVESRGHWQGLLAKITSQWGEPRHSLSNVVVTPNTPDMRPVYARARVLLAPSLWWESFGRVAAEAMLNGIPAVVTQRGGLPEVIGNAGLTVNLPEACYQPPYAQVPSAAQLKPVIERIERWFDDEAFYRSYVERAYAQGQQHRIENSTQRLIDALLPLALQRHQPRHNANSLAPPLRVRRILLNSFVGGPGSMGRVGYHALKHLVNRGYETHLLPFSNDQAAAYWDDDTRQRVTANPAALAADQQIKFCSVREAGLTRYARHVTPWFFHDVDGLSPRIVTAINANDAVYTSSHFIRDIFIAHGVRVPVTVLGHGVDPAHYRYTQRTVNGPFTFLCVAEPTPRKNLTMLVRAFQRAFGKRADVRLILKTALHDATALRQQCANAANIEIDARALRHEHDMAALYQQAHCFVLPTRFEGFGMPYLEAMATGLPVIATHYSGHLDFCRPDNSYLIDVKRMVAADTTCFPYLPGWWAEPDEDHLVSLMREVLGDYDCALAVGRKAHEHAVGEWTWQAQLDKVFPGPDSPAKDMR